MLGEKDKITNPFPTRDPFTDEEDVKLLETQLECGNRWSEIAKRLPGRSENAVKNRFNILYKKYREDVKYTEDVQEALNSVSVVKANETDWIRKLIEEKKKKQPREPKSAQELDAEYQPTITIKKSSNQVIPMVTTAEPKKRSKSNKEAPSGKDMEVMTRQTAMMSFEESKIKAAPAQLKFGGDPLSHGKLPHYHRRKAVSLPSSGWDRVVHARYGHQANGVG